MADAPVKPAVLFTAFEPSGDALAAGMIRKLLAARPGLPIWGMGGPRMEEAGASLLETTTGHAAMGIGAVAHILEHRRRLQMLRHWLACHSVSALVAVDSPAANWSICKLVRKTHPPAKILHLAAPQLWAWAPWRIGKLRRLTNHVLCLLPFEPAWFGARKVPASFVGHPIFASSRISSLASAPLPPDWPGQPGLKLALLPGSRQAEIRHNFPTMLAAYDALRAQHPGLSAVVAAVDDAKATQIQAILDARPSSTPPRALVHTVGRIDDVLTWADVVLVVSGTATLQVASHHKPMVTLFAVNRLQWQLVRWIIQTRTFTLPNLIAEAQGLGRIVPEIVPHWGPAAPVTAAIGKLLDEPAIRETQRANLERICASFVGRDFGDLATEEFLRVTGL